MTKRKRAAPVGPADAAEPPAELRALAAPEEAAPSPAAAPLPAADPAQAPAWPSSARQEKAKRAAHLLLFRRGRRPGARDWELRQRLGKDWEQHVKDLGDALAPLDLDVKRVEEPALAEGADPPVRYVAVLKGTLAPAEARMAGWRIDHLAGLAAAIGLILAKQGRAPRDEVEELLASRLGRWRSQTMVDSLVRSGYLREDDEGLLGLDWRTTAEVDVRELMGRLLAMKAEAAAPGGGEPDDEHEAVEEEEP